MTKKHVLFLCPHAAAKSVLAMTYFADLANKAGLDITTSNAGTEPDSHINPEVQAYLKKEGFNLNALSPSLLTDEHLATVNIVVSMGCISADRVPEGVEYIDWSDVPPLSADFQVARDRIYERVQMLIAELHERQ